MCHVPLMQMPAKLISYSDKQSSHITHSLKTIAWFHLANGSTTTCSVEWCGGEWRQTALENGNARARAHTTDAHKHQHSACKRTTWTFHFLNLWAKKKWIWRGRGRAREIRSWLSDTTRTVSQTNQSKCDCKMTCFIVRSLSDRITLITIELLRSKSLMNRDIINYHFQNEFTAINSSRSTEYGVCCSRCTQPHASETVRIACQSHWSMAEQPRDMYLSQTNDSKLIKNERMNVCSYCIYRDVRGSLEKEESWRKDENHQNTSWWFDYCYFYGRTTFVMRWE